MESFIDALQVLDRVLASHGRPTSVIWTGADDLRVAFGRTYARAVRPEISFELARQAFETARRQMQAIAIEVVGHSSNTTFARMEIATDSRDAELRMMSSEHVKVSIPENVEPPLLEIHSGTAWAAVGLFSG